MNFLSHYYIDWEIDDPHYTLGKILPDLLRNFKKGLRIKASEDIAIEFEYLQPLHKGIENHHQVDFHFHNSDFFKKYSNEIKVILKTEAYDSIRKYYYFYAHILLEMMLDRLLLKKNREIGTKFYEQLREIKKETISGFLRYNGVDIPAKEFFNYLSGFVNARYLFEYIDNDKLLYALGRINYRAGLYHFTSADFEKLKGKVGDIESLLHEDYLEIFSEIRKKIS